MADKPSQFFLKSLKLLSNLNILIVCPSILVFIEYCSVYLLSSGLFFQVNSQGFANKEKLKIDSIDIYNIVNIFLGFNI